MLPKEARDVFQIKPGDRLVVLGDEAQEHPGMALMKEAFFMHMMQMIKTALDLEEFPDEKEKE